MEGDVDSGCEDDVVLRNDKKHANVTERDRKSTILHTASDHAKISGDLNHKDRRENSKEFSLLPDKGERKEIRRNSSGYNSQDSVSISSQSSRKSTAAFNVYKLPEFAHVKSKVDSGLGVKKVSSPPIYKRSSLSPQLQKRSDPIPPTRYNRKYSTASFKVPEVPGPRWNDTNTLTTTGVTTNTNLNRNSANRRSLTRLFSRNTSESAAAKNKHNSKSNGIKTPFGDVSRYNSNGGSDEKRSHFSSKRSITSLSLFNSKKDEETSAQNGINNKERKNSFGRLRARSSLDLSSLGFGSVSRASSKSALTDLKEENDVINSTNKKDDVCSAGVRSRLDRPWFDLTRVWRDQTRDLPVPEDMFHKMKKERSGRARTVPSGLGSLESPQQQQSCVGVQDRNITDLCDADTGSGNISGGVPSVPLSDTSHHISHQHNSHHNSFLSSTCHTPSTLKKTVHLLSPEVLTNWYANRKKENLYGPRRNSISNLFFNPDKKQSSPVVELRNSDKLRKSMLNLEEILLGEGVLGNHGSRHKGIQRSESAKLTTEGKLEKYRWRAGKGIQRSESARLINMRTPSLQPRQNSHPNLVHQASFSSSSSSLADRSSVESPSKLTTYSLSNSDQNYQYNHPGNSDSDLEAEADPPDWRHTITEDELKKLSSKELKRQDVINELFHTEKSHVRNLKVLDSVFRRPLLESGRMSREFVDRLFPNLDEVLAVHAKFNSAMKLRVKQGFPIGDICDILTEMFLENNGDKIVEVCGEFTKNQNSTIEELKRLRSRDEKLKQFLSEIERNPACRRLQLQSLLPCVHTRLVKYPLLLEQLVKYSDHLDSTAELQLILNAKEKSKEIIDSIDKLVALQQNRLRLAEIQANLDTSGLDKMGSDHPIYREYKNLDLTRHILLYDGPLIMKFGDSKRVKQLHVILLEDCMMLLQKQGDKFLLKFHSSLASQSAASKEESRRLFHSPIIKYSTILVRHVATDKRAFYLLNTTERGPQIYELVAGSMSERTKWIKYITDASNNYKGGMPSKVKSEPDQLGVVDKTKVTLRSESFKEQPSSPRLGRADRQNSSPPEGFNIPRNPEDDSGSTTPSVPKKRLQRVEILKIVDSPPMVDPSQVVVNQARIMVADPVVTPFERLKQKDDEVSKILDEKQKLISEILDIDEDEFDTIADVAANNMSSTKDARDILLAALSQAKSLTSFVNNSLKVTENDIVRNKSPSRDSSSVTHDQMLPGPSGSQLVQITTSMNQHLTDLLAIIQERDMERDLLRRELSKCQDQIKTFFRSDSTRSFPSQVSTSSRPNSFISIESDTGEVEGDQESDQRPISLLSFSSDNGHCPQDTDDDSSLEASPIHNSSDKTNVPVNGMSPVDVDLTPTEEKSLVPSSDHGSDSDSDDIIPVSHVKNVSGDTDLMMEDDPRRFCLRNSVRSPLTPSTSSITSNTAISSSKGRLLTLDLAY